MTCLLDLPCYRPLEETGRPFVDRLQLMDYTSSRRPDATTLWVNVRLRWADLRITDTGRMPKRGEALALFVLTSGQKAKASELA